MATLEDEIRDLKEKNNELVQKVQYWKVAAANKENEKLELMKEINELRLKLSRLRSGGAAQARKLDAALQSSSEEALTHLVKASSAVARTIELAKTYMQDRQDLDDASPRWSAIGGTPNSERVHRVPPLLIGGQSIQPVVSLSRTLLNTSNSSLSRSINMSRSPNQNRSVTERAVPMHMLQDVYIPLTRIDVSELPGNNMETETESNDLDNSTEELGLEDSGERSVEDSQNMSESEDFESSRRLEAVTEDLEPEEIDETPPRTRTDNPLEGPSWLLDRPMGTKSRQRSSKTMNTLEPDSTTQLDENSVETPPLGLAQINEDEQTSIVAPAFTPTVRRRKRTCTPPRASRRDVSLSPDIATHPAFSPRPATARRNSNSGRVLKVLVAKMRLDSDSDSSDDATPPKRPTHTSPATKRMSRELVRDNSPAKKLMRFDAPSPNGATDARVIVLEQNQNIQSEIGSGEPMVASRRDSRVSSREGRKARRDCGDGQAKTAFGDSHTKPGQSRLADRQSGENRREERVGGGSSDDDKVTHRGKDNDRTGGVSKKKANVEQRQEDNEQSNEKKGNVSHRKTNIGKSDDQSNVSRQGLSDTVGHSDNMSRLGSMDHTSRMGSVGAEGRDSDSSTEQGGEGRTRRPRKQVTYKEKPLKGKLRR